MNGKGAENPAFVEEELFLAKQALFNAKTVKQLKFQQLRINYLKEKMKELNGG